MSIAVVVGIIRNKDGAVLVSKRSQGSHLPGFWEFPGGKVEKGEEKISALQRELKEELDINVKELCPLIEVSYPYSAEEIRISAFEVFRWTGRPAGKEGQIIEWVKVNAVRSLRLPRANVPIVAAMELPSVAMITGPYTGDKTGFLRKTEECLRAGVSLIQFRPQTSADDIVPLGKELVALSNHYGARVFVNSDVEIFNRIAAHGFHVTARKLLSNSTTAIPQNTPLSCSCHNPTEIRKAEELGAEFIYLGSLATTSSHPGRMGLGWTVAGQWVKASNIPVFALGGMVPSDIIRARHRGFQGVAMLSGFWKAQERASIIVEGCNESTAAAHLEI